MLYKAKQEEKKRLEKLMNETKSRYRGGAYFDKKKSCFFRYKVKDSYKYYKKKNNKAIRRNPDVGNGNHFKKLNEFWWDVT